MRDSKVVVAVLVLGSLLFPGEGSTQEHRLTPEVALMRLCISEANWECISTGDGLGIHEVIARGAMHQDIRYESYARAYARRLFGARPHDVPRLRWVGELTPACTEPEHWPLTIMVRRRDGTTEIRPHARWATFRERCLAVAAWAAETVVQHAPTDVDHWSICERPVHDWGGAMDRLRASRLGLVPVLCELPPEVDENGELVRRVTQNDFYCRPSLDAGCVLVDQE